MKKNYFYECCSQLKVPFLLLLFLLIVNGCSTTKRTVAVPTGKIETPGIKIVDSKGIFTLYSGKEFVTPFNSDCTFISNTKLLERMHIKLKDAYLYALGARNVELYKNELSSPLYGVLAFCKVNANAVGPASRSYLIQVPQNYIDAASNGGISVVYEVVSNARGGDEGYGWVLWLSDNRFPDIK